MTVREVILSALSSRSTVMFLLFLWTVSIFGSIRYLAPGGDDALWIYSAVGFFETGKLSLYYGPQALPYYHIFPTYPFATAVFYWGWMLLGLPINLATYKVFHLLTLVALVWSSAWLLKRSANDDQVGRFRAVCFMSVLGIVPFALDAFYPRPEPLGILLTILAVAAYDSGLSDRNGYGLAKLGLSGFLLGAAATCHPSFWFTSAGVALVAAIHLGARGRWRYFGLAAAMAVLPLVAVVGWYALDWPASYDQLAINAYRAGNFGMPLSMAWHVLAFKDGTSLANAFQWVFYASFMVVIPVTAVLIFRRISSRDGVPISTIQGVAIGIFLLCMVYLGVEGSGRVQVFAVASFFVLFAGAVFIRDDGKMSIVST